MNQYDRIFRILEGVVKPKSYERLQTEFDATSRGFDNFQRGGRGQSRPTEKGPRGSRWGRPRPGHEKRVFDKHKTKLRSLRKAGVKTTKKSHSNYINKFPPKMMQHIKPGDRGTDAFIHKGGSS